jgi:GntR family transcriptional regulator
MGAIKGLRLDKGIPMPLYEQLRQGLLTAIMDGTLPAGSKMPTEEELCATYGISRPVVRQAYNALIESGHVERKRGVGTFVLASNSRGRFIDKQYSFEKEMSILGLPHKTILLREEWLDGGDVLFKDQAPYTGRVRHIVRMRYAAGKPFVLVENFVPESVFPGIDTYDFAVRSLYNIMETEYGVHIARSHRKIAAILADEGISSALEIARNAPVMFVENLVYDQYDRAVDLSREYLDGSTKTFEFQVFNS